MQLAEDAEDHQGHRLPQRRRRTCTIVHANSGNRDKNCRACHLSHAGPNERIIRTSLRYGKWDMPMHFQKTETGGSCFPGCHAQWAYDREKPVPTVAPTTLPTSFPALVATRAEREDGQMITWSATDVSGKAVSVPADGHSTALVLVAADDASADQVIDRLHNAVGQVKDTQVVVIFSAQAPSSERRRSPRAARPALGRSSPMPTTRLPRHLVYAAGRWCWCSGRMGWKWRG